MNKKTQLVLASLAAALVAAGCASGPSVAELNALTSKIVKASFRDESHVKVERLTATDETNTAFGRGEQNNLTALSAYISAESRGMKFNLPNNTVAEKTMYEVGKRLFFARGGTHDFSCSSCHGEDGKRIRLQDLPNLTQNPGAGNGFGAWPAYRVSNGQMWSMQLRLNDCYRQQRFPYPLFGSDVTIALGMYLGVNGKGGESVAPAIKR